MVMMMMGDVIVAHNTMVRHHMTIVGEGHPLSKGGVPEVEVVEDLLVVMFLEEGAMTIMGEIPPP